MSKFDQACEEWLHSMIAEEQNHRRRELLQKGLGHGTREFLRSVWFPAVKSFDHLQPEWDVRDFNNGYRYLDLAYLPGGDAKGGIEIQGFGPSNSGCCLSPAASSVIVHMAYEPNNSYWPKMPWFENVTNSSGVIPGKNATFRLFHTH